VARPALSVKEQVVAGLKGLQVEKVCGLKGFLICSGCKSGVASGNHVWHGLAWPGGYTRGVGPAAGLCMYSFAAQAAASPSMVSCLVVQLQAQDCFGRR
jgi:hypothetical protein